MRSIFYFGFRLPAAQLWQAGIADFGIINSKLFSRLLFHSAFRILHSEILLQFPKYPYHFSNDGNVFLSLFHDNRFHIGIGRL